MRKAAPIVEMSFSCWAQWDLQSMVIGDVGVGYAESGGPSPLCVEGWGEGNVGLRSCPGLIVV